MRKITHPPEVPLPELAIEGPWAQTLQDEPQRFLLADNRALPRVILFASDACLRLLAEPQAIWFVDGNFALAPAEFAQLYVIRVKMGQTAVSTVYGLLTHKSQATYEDMFEAVAQGCVAAGFAFPQPALIHLDFEKAVMNAATTVFPGAQLRGCFYHLTQV